MHTTVNEEKVTTTARDTDSKKDTRKVALRARTLMDCTYPYHVLCVCSTFKSPDSAILF